MIFVLKNADFSANNLGNITIPINYTQHMTDYFTALENSSLSESKKQAAAHLVNDMQNVGIFSKVSYLFLPCMSGDLAHSLVNLAGSDLEIITPTNGTFTDGALSIPNVRNVPAQYLPKFANLNGKNLHWMYLSTISNGMIGIGDNQAHFFARTEINDNNIIPTTSSYRSGANLTSGNCIVETVSTGGSNKGNGIFTGIETGVFFKGYINSSTRPKYLRNGEISVLPETWVDNTSHTHTYTWRNDTTPYSQNSGIIEVDSCAVISIGSELSEEEAIQYQNIVHLFAQRMGIM